MLSIRVKNTREILYVSNREKVYRGDNNITSLKLILPDSFDNYKTSECSIELKAYNSEDEYVSYNLDVKQDDKGENYAEQYIGWDLTYKEHTVKLVIIVRHGLNIIGRTNSLPLVIHENEDVGDTKIMPRDELDVRIAELEDEKNGLNNIIDEQIEEIAEKKQDIDRKQNQIDGLNIQVEELKETNREANATISEQSQTIDSQNTTISEQSQTISQQSSQITELNDEVEELENENGELKTQHTADQNTIQYLIDNPPGVRLQPKSVNPINQMQVVEPDEGYQGLSTVTIGAVIPPRLQSKQVTPSEEAAYITADDSYDGLSSVTVNAVDSSIDSDIQPENIKEGIDILGVEGTYNPFPEQSYGGVYFTNVDEDGYPTEILVKNVDGKSNNLWLPVVVDIIKPKVKKLVMESCKNISSLIYGSSSANVFENGVIETLILCGVESIGTNFCLRTGLLKNLSLDGVKSIGTNAFRYFNAETLRIPSGVETIGTTAFADGKYKYLEIPNSLTSLTNNSFAYNSSLQNVIIENGFNCNNLNLSDSTRYSVENIVSWLEALADRTGETAYTLTIGTNNLNKLTAEQKAIAINKNWNLA